MPDTNNVVLDSHALLAFLRGEIGEEKVAALLEKASQEDEPLHMTEVNYAEVKYTIIRKQGLRRWEEIARDLDSISIRFHSIDRRLSDLAADYKSLYKISLADAFAAALAKELKASLVTGDPEFAALEHEISILWLR